MLHNTSAQDRPGTYKNFIGPPRSCISDRTYIPAWVSPLWHLKLETGLEYHKITFIYFKLDPKLIHFNPKLIRTRLKRKLVTYFKSIKGKKSLRLHVSLKLTLTFMEKFDEIYLLILKYIIFIWNNTLAFHFKKIGYIRTQTMWNKTTQNRKKKKWQTN